MERRHLGLRARSDLSCPHAAAAVHAAAATAAAAIPAIPAAAVAVAAGLTTAVYGYGLGFTLVGR